MAPGHVDVAVLSEEAHGEPDLLLAPEGGELVRRPVIGRKIVSQPAVGAAQDLHVRDARLLPKLPARRCLLVLVRVDPALRHLPFEPGQNRLGAVVPEAAGDQHLPSRVEQGDAYVAAVWQGGWIGTWAFSLPSAASMAGRADGRQECRPPPA
jgi:hypothetical protein